MVDNNDFMREQQLAIERMKEMSRRSGQSAPHTMPPAPPFVKFGRQQDSNSNQEYTNNYSSNQHTNQPQNSNYNNNKNNNSNNNAKRASHGNNAPMQPCNNNSFLGLDIPFLDKIQSEPDITLILGLLLLLWSEKADKKLLLALLYILF